MRVGSRVSINAIGVVQRMHSATGDKFERPHPDDTITVGLEASDGSPWLAHVPRSTVTVVEEFTPGTVVMDEASQVFVRCIHHKDCWAFGGAGSEDYDLHDTTWKETNERRGYAVPWPFAPQGDLTPLTPKEG